MFASHELPMKNAVEFDFGMWAGASPAWKVTYQTMGVFMAVFGLGLVG